MATSPSPSPLGPPLASRYEVRRKLGSGSMGTVYLAEDTRTRGLVALKILRTDRISPKAVARLQLEFRALSSLHHPQIAAAFDFGYTEWGGLPYYTREYVDGSPLPPGPPARIRPREFLRPILDLLDALSYLHAHEILHLDIHAGNLIVAGDRTRGSVLIDFGLMRYAEVSERRRGRVDLPPELLEDGRTSVATDLFLAGRLLLYRLSGRTEGEVRLPRELGGWGTRLTLELERITDKAIQRDPEQRFSTARDFREALERALGESGPHLSDTEPRDVILARDDVLKRIDERLQQAGEGKGAVLWLVGSAGMGKTRLLKEARLRAQLRGLDVVEVRFLVDPGPRGPLLPRALRTMGAADGDTAWLEPLSAEHGGSPAERARRAARAYYAGAGKPLVLLLDDIESADADSTLLANALVEESIGGSGLVRRRGMGIFLAGARSALRRLPRTAVCHLRPLRANEAKQLLRLLLGGLRMPPGLERRALSLAVGSLRDLHRLARVLRERWGRAGYVPATAELPDLSAEIPTYRGPDRRGRDPRASALLEALVILRRPVTLEELVAASRLEIGDVAKILRRLRRDELVAVSRQGRTTYYLPGRSSSRDYAISPDRSRAIHRRLIPLLRKVPSPSISVRENLARHLLYAGNREEGGRAALRVARELANQNSFERAIRLLSDAASLQQSVRDRLRFTEELSAILDETGDHERGIALLEPFCRRGLRRLGAAAAVRVRRRLGVHYHRAGRADRALALFREACRVADPARDVEDLVHVDAELAELCTLRGNYRDAEEACRRGLERLETLGKSTPSFRQRMELVLRASLGHLELRRMNLGAAREALTSAQRLAGRLGATGARAVILNNLGIAENQLNQFSSARVHFRRAERLLLRAGDHRAVIEIACNLAILSAKLGEDEAARGEIARAEELLRQYPGQRFEFFVPFARGVVACILGDPEAAMEAFEVALPLGRELGDLHLVRFSEVYLAEAQMLCGRYSQARRQLRATLARAAVDGSTILRKMVHGRLAVVEALSGQRPRADGMRDQLSDLPRGDLQLLEAWNDTFHAIASILSGKSGAKGFGEASMVFRRLKVPFGERVARLGLLAEVLLSDDPSRARPLIEELESLPLRTHRLLAVLEPLLLAEATFGLGEYERASRFLAEASGAIVGHPFLELDWWLEFLRSRLARRSGDIEGARRHLHRSIHTRDLLLQFVPRDRRAVFLAQARFRALTEAGSWLERLTPTGPSTASIHASGKFEGMVGRSEAMIRVFEAIGRLKDQELPVLISGETGTGKELVARALHATSPRAQGRFLAIHCASLPGELLEAELFGYEAGAFTGAEETRSGLFETISGGTLLLDAVDELAPAAQAKILRVLDAGVIRRLGSLEPRPIDVRFLAASSQDLASAAREGLFRADLYYRLRGEEIRIPPLRARRDDIAPLARYFLEQHALRLDRPPPVLRDDAVAILERQHWAGNVRELETVLLRVLLGGSDRLAVDAAVLTPFLPRPSASVDGDLFDGDKLSGRDLEELKRELERSYILRLFRDVGGDLEKLMATLKVKRSRLYVLLRKLGIDVRVLRGGHESRDG